LAGLPKNPSKAPAAPIATPTAITHILSARTPLDEIDVFDLYAANYLICILAKAQNYMRARLKIFVDALGVLTRIKNEALELETARFAFVHRSVNRVDISASRFALKKHIARKATC
jgi:hypothetical protein